MMSKRLVIALMLLVGATSATLAQGHHHNRAGYGQDPDPASGRAYYRNGPVYDSQPGYENDSGYASGQPGPDSSIEAIR